MKETLTQSSGSLSFLLHQTSYIILMQLVVPNAVRNAVSAATTIFTANSIHLFFSMISYFLHLTSYISLAASVEAAASAVVTTT